MPGPATEQSIERGILAYKNRDFKQAIAILLAVTDQEPNNWRAKLYLGMSYFNCGDVVLASGQFHSLTGTCTDIAIRDKAQTALSALSSQVQAQAKMPQMSCTIKKPEIAKAAATAESKANEPVLDMQDDDPEVEQVVCNEGYYQHADHLATDQRKPKKGWFGR